MVILSITLFKSENIRSQDHLEIGNQWIHEYYEILGPGVYTNHKIDSITITKDTLINNKTYFQLISTRKHLCGIFGSSEYLREEENKIYRLAKDSQTEFLLIDFNEQDSYEIKSENGPEVIEAEAIIDSFGTTTFPSGHIVETQFMKIINNQSYDDETQYAVHRKIGFLNPGLLFPDIGTGLCDFFQRTQKFKCFISNQDTIKFTETDCFEFTIINSTTDVKIEQIELHPNPTFDYVNLPNNLKFLKSHNVNGLEVSIIELENKLNLANLKKGIYIITMENSSGEKFISKVVKL